MTEEAKPQSTPEGSHKIIFKVPARDMRAISQAAKKAKITVSQYARQALFLRIEKDQANG